MKSKINVSQEYHNPICKMLKNIARYSSHLKVFFFKINDQLQFIQETKGVLSFKIMYHNNGMNEITYKNKDHIMKGELE